MQKAEKGVYFDNFFLRKCRIRQAHENVEEQFLNVINDFSKHLAQNL